MFLEALFPCWENKNDDNNNDSDDDDDDGDNFSDGDIAEERGLDK